MHESPPIAVAAPPLVSIVMPVRNEAGFIARTLDQVLAQDYPADRLEVIVADGMSDDGTREIVASYRARDARVRLVDNPDRITPCGLNVALAAARGDVICRIDGHCEVAEDFIRQSVALMEEHPEAWVVGGPIVHAGRNLLGQAVAVAMAHPCGVGMATHRFSGYEGYVEGAQFPAFHRWVFERVGAFDEQLVRNQDDELNYRINQAGGRIFISPRVRYVYYVRGRLGQLFRQYFQYSFWRIPVIRKHKRPTTPRQVVPLAFFTMMLVLAVAGVWLGLPWLALFLPLAYVAALALTGLSVMPQHGVRVGLLLPVVLATMHVAYAAGMAYGMFALMFNPRAWDRASRMTQLSR